MAGPGTKTALADNAALFAKQRILIIEGRYYDDVGDQLLAAAKAELDAAGAAFEHLTVPGALEIPQVLAQAVEKGLIGTDAPSPRYSGVVALGCVIRGETYHFEIVSDHTNHWLMEIATCHAVPVGNAVLTVDTHEQAMVRARDGKGADAVRACLRLIEIAATFDGQTV